MDFAGAWPWQAGFVAHPNEALTDAIRQGAPLEAVRSIVEGRPHLVREFDRYGYWPIHAAVESGAPLEVLEYLHSCSPSSMHFVITEAMNLPLHCVGHRTPPECVAFLLDRDPRSIKERNWFGDLPVHCAIFRGAQRDAVRVLVERYPRCLEEWNAEGFQPIHAAALATGPTQLDVLRYLLEVSPRSVRTRSTPVWGDQLTLGELPLHLALQVEATPDDHHGPGRRSADPAVVRLLLEKWPDSVRERARTWLPLHYAMLSVSRPSLRVVRALLDAFPEALQETCPDGSTVLHKLARNISRRHGLLHLIIDSWPESLLEADAAGDLPIHAALGSFGCSSGTAWLLIERCPQSLRVANSQGKRPVHVAIARDNDPAVRMIAERSPEALRDADRDGNTPAHLAATCDYVSSCLARYVVEAWPESLLATNIHGDTPAHVAIDRAYPSTEVVKIFVERCPEALRVANAKGSPLVVAIARSHLAIARLVMEHVPELARQADSRGNLPLFLAAENESMDLDVVFLLLRAWPDVVLGSQPSSSGGLATSGKRKRSPSMG